MCVVSKTPTSSPVYHCITNCCRWHFYQPCSREVHKPKLPLPRQTMAVIAGWITVTE
jgi:hypothetical protein